MSLQRMMGLLGSAGTLGVGATIYALIDDVGDGVKTFVDKSVSQPIQDRNLKGVEGALAAMQLEIQTEQQRMQGLTSFNTFFDGIIGKAMYSLASFLSDKGILPGLKEWIDDGRDKYEERLDIIRQKQADMMLLRRDPDAYEAKILARQNSSNNQNVLPQAPSTNTPQGTGISKETVGLALGGTALAGGGVYAAKRMSSGKGKVAEAAVEGGVGAATKAATESPILNSAGKPFVHAAEEVAEGAAVAATKVGRFKSLLGKIPVIGKYLGVAAVVGGTATAIMTPGSAQASVTSEKEGSITTTKGAVNEAGVELASIGASALAATPAAAVFAGKQIPGFGAVFAAGDAIYGTVKHALRGDFDKAGTRFVAGVGETVAGLGGFTTYATVGSAWRELVREGGQKLFGEDRAIDHSFVGQAALLAKDFATAKDNDRTRDNTEQQPVAQYGVNPLWQPLGFASGPV